MRHIKLFQEHLPTSGWQGDLPEYKTWWIELDESDQNRYCQEFFPDKCSSSNSKYFPNDQEIKDMWLEVGEQCTTSIPFGGSKVVSENVEKDIEKSISVLKDKIKIQEDKMGRYPSKNLLDMILSYKEELKELESKNEGRTYNDTKAGLFPKKSWDPNKKRDFLLTIKNHIKSKELTSKQVGNDLEIICNDKMIAQVMFRDSYVGVRAKGAKFADEFEYTELGKIKAKISEIVKDCK